MPRQSARDAVRQRTAFFASLGHDLKTPLNAIIGYADMMRHGVRGPLPEAYQDYPAIIHDSGQELLLMVEDMLDLARPMRNGIGLSRNRSIFLRPRNR
jgi:cell cycle sensor histidine kinase DivJ